VKKHCHAMQKIEAHESNELAMYRYRQEHPNEVQVKYEFFAMRNVAEKTIEEKKEEELKEIMWQIDAHESDEVAMERYREEHPEEVHAEYEFFAVVTQHTTACFSMQVIDITLVKYHFINITSLRVVQQKHSGLYSSTKYYKP
jgi:hypothetical protein